MRPTTFLHDEVTRMAKQAVANAVDAEPIDRLEEKVKLLIGMIATFRAEQGKASDENARLIQEIDALRSRLSSAERTNEELVTLREERDEIRSRVADMLQQLEAI
jgi:regulator of replication initiation timing